MSDRNFLGDVRIVLDSLMEKFPPGDGQRHVLGVQNDKLSVWLFLGKRYLPIVFEEDDFSKSVGKLCDELIAIARKAIEEGLLGVLGDEND